MEAAISFNIFTYLSNQSYLHCTLSFPFITNDLTRLCTYVLLFDILHVNV